MKKIVMISVVLSPMLVSVYADQLPTVRTMQPEVKIVAPASKTKADKIKAIKKRIESISLIIEQTPMKIEKKKEVLERLQAAGGRVEDVLKKLLTANAFCINPSNSVLKRECEAMLDIDLELTILTHKNEVEGMIKLAQSEFNEIKTIVDDIPKFKALLDALRSAEEMLRSGY